jgi:hypothetical protein
MMSEMLRLNEIGRLNGNEARVLLVLCYLGKESADEIGGILGFFRYDVQNALETLQAFSMTGIHTALPGGAVFEIPSTLSLVADLVEKRVADWKTIKSKCISHEKLTGNLGYFVGEAVRRTIGLLNARDFEGAKETVNTLWAKYRTILICFACGARFSLRQMTQDVPRRISRSHLTWDVERGNFLRGGYLY